MLALSFQEAGGRPRPCPASPFPSSWAPHSGLHRGAMAAVFAGFLLAPAASSDPQDSDRARFFPLASVLRGFPAQAWGDLSSRPSDPALPLGPGTEGLPEPP